MLVAEAILNTIFKIIFNLKINSMKNLIKKSFFTATLICMCSLIWAGVPIISNPGCFSAVTGGACVNITVNSNGATISGITALGDIEIVSSSTAGAITTLCIRSKDNITFKDCIGAYGKGRINVTYTDGGCGGTTFLDIYKNTVAQPIIGPVCVAVGEDVTYSVCKILSTDPNLQIGQDNYTWTVPAGFTLKYKSADNSSQTYTVTAIPTTPLQVQFGQCTPGAIATLNIVKKIPNPQTLLVPTTPICLAANSTSLNFSVNTANNPAGCTYTWSVDNPNWTLSTTTGTATTVNVDGGVGNVTLVVSNASTGVGCGAVTTVFKVNRNLTGLSFLSTCIAKPGTATLSLTGANGISTIPVNWSFAPVTGWSNSPLNGSTTIVSASATAVNTVATASSVACPTPTVVRNLVITPTLPNNPTGTTCLTPGSTASLTYTVAGATNATGYTWTFPAGWVVVSGAGTATVVVTPNGTTAGNITVTANNVFTSAAGTTTCSSTARTITTAFIPSAPTAVNLPTCFSVGNAAANAISRPTTTFQLSVNPPVSGLTYTWGPTFPAGIALASTSNTSGATANIATFNFTGTPGTYTIPVKAGNATCAASSTFNASVVIPAPSLTISSSGGAGTGLQTLSFTALSSTISTVGWYRFQAPSTITPVGAGIYTLPASGGQTQYNCALNNTATAGTYCVDIVGTNGCTTTLCFTPTAYGARMVNPDATTPKPNPFTKMEIMPNPAKTEFSIVLPEDNTQVLVFDMKGTQVFNKTLNTGKQSINSNDWSAGEYIIVFSKEGNTETRKIAITK